MVTHDTHSDFENIDTGPLWIGVVGAAKSGKSTFADVMSDMYRIRQPYLATPIKSVAMDYYGMSREDCYNHGGKARIHPYMEFENGDSMTNRQVLERVGDKLQELDPLVLLRAAKKRLQKNSNGDFDAAIFPDLRTKPQEEFIRDEGGIIVYIQRDSAEEVAETLENPHHTKTFYQRAEPDITIYNNDMKSAFKRLVSAVFRSYKTQRTLFPHRVNSHS